MTDKEALKLALDDLMVEYDMERTSFAKRVDEIFKQTPPAAQRPWVGLTVDHIETIEAMALTKNMAIVMTMATLKEKNT